MKRDPRLQGLSQEHHTALVLARNARRPSSDALARSAARRDLLDAFDSSLAPHFAVEEEILLPALQAAGQAVLVARTRDEHRRLRELRHAIERGDEGALEAFGDLLDEHVRFEERVLFPACETALASEVLDEVARRSPVPAP